MLELLKEKAKEIKRELTALYLAYRHPEVPWYAKLFTAIVIGYALSPIDLIPDFIPVLGYLDDLILIPIGIKIALKMIPEHVMIECREQAVELERKNLGSSWIAAGVILAIWVLIGWGVISSIL
jgi:uncharacterized membrane protein YkvA (DUF1232 family)